MNTFIRKQKDLFDQIEKSLQKGSGISSVVEPVDNYVKDSRLCLTTLSFIPKNIFPISSTAVQASGTIPASNKLRDSSLLTRSKI